MRVRTELIAGNGLIIGVFIIVTIVSVLSIKNLITDSQWVAHTHNVKATTKSILGHIVDQETGVRGFMATGDETFLESYHSGRAMFEDDLAKAKTLVSDNPTAQGLFQEVGRFAREWHQIVITPYLETRRAVNQGKTAQIELMTFINSGEGKRRMDAFRETWLKVYANTSSEETKNACWGLLLDMINMETGMRGFLMTGKESYLEPFNEGFCLFEKRLSILELANIPGVGALKAQAHDWVNLAGKKTISLKKTVLKFPTDSVLEEMMGKQLGKQYVDNIRETISTIVQSEMQLLAEREESRQKTASQSIRITIFGAVIATLIVFGFVWLLLRDITRPVVADMKFAQAIAKGDYDTTVEVYGKNELADLAQALNSMAEGLREIDWLKRGKEGLDDELRGEHDVKDFIRRFIAYFTKHLDSQLGALYLAEGDQLTLSASHAFSDRKGNYNSYKFGEGMVGQAALENETIIFTHVEDDAPGINYGAGNVTPASYMIVPISFEGTLFGVLLLGTMDTFTRQQRLFVEQNIDNVAILFNAAKSRETINILLEEAKVKQEELRASNDELEAQARLLKESEAELQSQQEELRVTNEELEEQTRALKNSEAELQAQQEELRVTNEELEEHTQELEKQKEAIQKQHTDLVKSQETVKQKARDLEIASKYKSEFLANMSHELRTPLNSILILSQLFGNNKDGNLTDKQVESAKAIHKSGSELLTLINEILDLSKVEAGKIDLVIEEVKIRDMITDLNRLFKEVAADKGVDFEVAITNEVPSIVTTDSQRLQQVLRNLLSNAFKFTEQGRVDLTIHRPAPETIPEELDPLTSVAYVVRDQGIGIPKEKQAAIFEAFQQADGSTSRNFGGTGLGLSISKGLVKLLGGVLQLASEEGKGSTFTVILPQDHVPVIPGTPGDKEPTNFCPPPTGDEPRPAPSPVSSVSDTRIEDKTKTMVTTTPQQVRDDRKKLSHSDKSLLIIEDDSKFARVMRDFARDRGFKVIIAEDGETGLHFADYYDPSAIILDIGLPGIDGWTVMERLKNNPKLRHIPVHFMSAADSSQDAMLMGAVGYLSKPVSVEKVEEAFSRIEEIISKPVSRLLIVEDDKIQRESIKQLIGDGDVKITAVATGAEAISELGRGDYDCMILDLGLEDMSGFELIDKICINENTPRVPIIVYTGRDLNRDEETQLKRYAESIIIKGAKSPERLLDESALFLHRVKSDLPDDKRQMLKMTHDQEAVLAGSTILLVDDDMRNVFALSSVLEEKSINVIIAKNGLEALEKLKENKTVNLVLMDIMMPIMDGYEAMREIRKDSKYAKLPIIALTAKAMKGDRSKCIEAGANDYLAKPVNTDKLISMLRVWLY